MDPEASLAAELLGQSVPARLERLEPGELRHCAGRLNSSKKSARAGGSSLSARSVTWST